MLHLKILTWSEKAKLHIDICKYDSTCTNFKNIKHFNYVNMQM